MCQLKQQENEICVQLTDSYVGAWEALCRYRDCSEGELVHEMLGSEMRRLLRLVELEQDAGYVEDDPEKQMAIATLRQLVKREDREALVQEQQLRDEYEW